jgi:hypothetical protein
MEQLMKAFVLVAVRAREAKIDVILGSILEEE